MVAALSHTLKGCIHSQPGHTPRWWVLFPLVAHTEGNRLMFLTHQCFSLSLPILLSLSKISIYISTGEDFKKCLLTNHLDYLCLLPESIYLLSYLSVFTLKITSLSSPIQLFLIKSLSNCAIFVLLECLTNLCHNTYPN